MLSYTFYMGFLSNETLEWRQLHCDAVLYILYGILVRQYHNGAVFIPVFHWTRISYKMYKTASQWSRLHSSISLDKQSILHSSVLWCCLIHFIWDSCPMKHWNDDSSIVMLSYTFYMGFLSNETLNEDSSIVMLSYTFYMGFLSNETLEWRHLHCDAVLYILYGILMYKTALQWSCLHSSVSLDKNPI
jgi:hypothetical protein